MKLALPEAAPGVAALLGGALVAAGAWLFLPRERSGGSASRAAVRVCLVDVSASAVARRAGWRGFVERELDAQRAAAGRAGEDLEVVLFGSEVRRHEGPLPVVAGERASRLAGALEVARGIALDPSRRGASVVLIGDRTYTGEDPAPGIAALRRAGVDLACVDLPPPDRREVVIGPLALPAELEAGAPIAVEADVFLAPGASPMPERIPVAIEAGGDRRTVEIDVPRGLALDADGYARWRLRRDAGTAVPGPNRIRVGESEGVVGCAGRLAVGVVGPHLDLASEPGLELVAIPPADLGSTLAALDALESGALSAEALAPAVLRSFVEHGGGFFRIAAPGASRPTEEGPALPLLPPDDREPRDVVVLVDRSGSMAGEPFESVRRAVLELVDAAPAEDAVELRFFGDRLSDPVALKASRDARERDRILREAAERFFGGGGPGGRTAIARSLEAFADARERSGRVALVFLLSDGKDTVDPDAADRCARVLSRLLAARARLVAIAADASDPGLLRSLVAPGETLRSVGPLATSSAGLAAIFRREVEKDRFREGDRLRVLPAPAAKGSLAADVLGSAGAGEAASWPTISRYARARLAPGAEAILVSDRGEPLLAIHRVGQGLVAACAFEDEAFDHKAGGPDPAWSRLLAPLLRVLARGKKGMGARARLEDGVLSIEGLPADAPAELEARLFAAGADRPTRIVALSPPLEGGDPRRTRSAAAPDLDLGEGSPRVEIRARGLDGTWPPVDLALAAPRSPESALPRPRLDADLFREPVVAGASRFPAGPRAHPAAPWVLFSGLVLLTLSGLGGFFSRRASRLESRAPGRQAIAGLDRRDTP